MLNEEKIRLMTKLAMYEEKEGKKVLPIAKYFRSDYLGVALIKNFFLTSIAYLLILIIFGGANFDFILDNIHKMNLFSIISLLVAMYLILMVVYSVITYIYFTVKYKRSQNSLKNYDHNLKELLRMYNDEGALSSMNESKEEV